MSFRFVSQFWLCLCVLALFWVFSSLFICVIAERSLRVEPIRLQVLCLLRGFRFVRVCFGLFRILSLTLIMLFAPIFMVIFVFSTSKYVSIRGLNNIGGMRFSEAYHYFPSF